MKDVRVVGEGVGQWKEDADAQGKEGGEMQGKAEVATPSVAMNKIEEGVDEVEVKKASRKRNLNKAKLKAGPEPLLPLHFADCSPVWRAFYELIAKDV